MEIDPRYRIHLKGTYWAGINTCPHCNWSSTDSITGEIIGFANSQYGLMTVVECPECFKKWHFHARDLEKGTYYYFKLWVQNGWQKHFKGTEGTPEDLPKLIKPGRQ
jgi:hypothetical protein